MHMATRAHYPYKVYRTVRLLKGTFIPKWVTFYEGAMKEAFRQIVPRIMIVLIKISVCYILNTSIEVPSRQIWLPQLIKVLRKKRSYRQRYLADKMLLNILSGVFYAFTLMH